MDRSYQGFMLRLKVGVLTYSDINFIPSIALQTHVFNHEEVNHFRFRAFYPYRKNPVKENPGSYSKNKESP